MSQGFFGNLSRGTSPVAIFSGYTPQFRRGTGFPVPQMRGTGVPVADSHKLDRYLTQSAGGLGFPVPQMRGTGAVPRQTEGSFLEDLTNFYALSEQSYNKLANLPPGEGNVPTYAPPAADTSWPGWVIPTGIGVVALGAVAFALSRRKKR